jgi:hypothetical protein
VLCGVYRTACCGASNSVSPWGTEIMFLAIPCYRRRRRSTSPPGVSEGLKTPYSVRRGRCLFDLICAQLDPAASANTEIVSVSPASDELLFAAI